MNDLDKRAFEDAYSNIKAPADLKADTLEEMAREEEKYKEIKEQKKESKSNRNIFYYGALAAALCAAVFCIFLLRPEGISYVTSMEEGVYYDEVELENGVIHFVANRVAISNYAQCRVCGDRTGRHRGSGGNNRAGRSNKDEKRWKHHFQGKKCCFSAGNCRR